ncbi:hypothetical protein R3P38DRAFT_3019189 [Favolaschia claudopus]|uniref:Uncharacterized protein n=1 Tax=Favolaschia claudopus TaxID=2862362 RepID=A0AAW0AHA5_9AGAR
MTQMHFRDLNPAELGGCNNPQCRIGCGFYSPAPGHHGRPLATTPCDVCGCVGAQHREPVLPPAPAPTFSSSSIPVPSNTYPIPTPAPAPSSPSAFPTSEFTFSAGPTTTSPTPIPSRTSSFSATAQTMFAARPAASAAHASTSTSTAQRGRSPLRGSTSGPHSFRNLAQSRHRDSVAAMGRSGEASSSKIFHPALSAQKEADLNPLRSKSQRKRKRRDDPSPSHERNVRGKPTPTSEPKPPPAKRTNYCFAAIPFTKEVNRGNCTVPAAHELLYFEEGGYIKIITISSDDSPHDIQTKIAINYSHIQAFNDFGFRLLAVTRKVRRAKPGGKPLPKAGVARILRPIKRVLDHDALQIALSDSNIRKSGPRYRKIVFIALNPAGPNLPFHGMTYDPNDNLDHDLPSDHSESESSDDEATSSSEDDNENSDVTMEDGESGDRQEEAGNKTGTNKGKEKAAPFMDPKGKGKQRAGDMKGKGKQKAEDSHFDTGFFDEDVAASAEYDSDNGPHFEGRSPVPDSGLVVPQTHLTMVRLLHNMQQPDAKASRRAIYWADNEGDSRGPFISGNKAAEVLSFIESNICQPFLMLSKLGKRLAGQAEQIGADELEADFDEGFAIGPGGLHGLAPHLQTAYISLPVALKAGASHDAYLAVFDNLTDLSLSLLRCLRHLRAKYHRSEWDPRGGCRELAVILHTKDSSLPVATEADFDHLNLRLLLNSLEKDPPNVSEINFLLMDALGDASNPREMTAEHELVMARILDDLDTGHPDYISILACAQSASAGIARKIRNFFKGGGMNGSYAARRAGASSGPNTRSRSKRTTWKSDEEFDDMTNTDSLASGWELDCSTTERDIRVRRADRRRRKGTKAKSPPIIISSDSESSTTTSSDSGSSSDSSSDGMFKKACNDWTRSRRRASASNNAKTNTNASSSNQSTTASPRANAEAASSSSSTQPSDNARAGPSRPSRVPPPPLSQTRARPTWLDSTALESDDIEDATTILRRSPTRYWQGLMREILERFPHPDPSRRLTMDALLAPGMTRTRQYHLLSLAYHVDRNVSGSAHWIRIAGILSQILNDTRRYKLDDPRIVPLGRRY